MLESCLRIFSVEPLVMVYSLAIFMGAAGTQNLYLQKECFSKRQPGINDVCQNPESIATAADVNTLRTVLRECVPMVTVLVSGAWRDRTHRSVPLIVLPLVGEILSTVCTLVGFFIWSSSSWIIAAVEGSVVGITGGKPLVLMACVCHITEKASPKSRINRISYFLAAFTLGAAVANGISGYILSYFGYQNFFIIIITLHLISICLAYIFIKDDRKSKDVRFKTTESVLKLNKFKTVFKTGKKNAIVWCMLVSACLVNTTILGENNVVFYFFEGTFGMSVTLAGVVLGYSVGMTLISTIILSPLLTKLFKLSDYKIAMIGFFFCLAYPLFMIFATTTLEIILFAPIDCMRVVMISVLKSLMASNLNSDDTGIYFSLGSIGESLFPVLLLPLYDLVFHSTQTTFPGAFYLISATLHSVVFILLCISILASRLSDKNDEEKKDDNSQDIEKSNNIIISN